MATTRPFIEIWKQFAIDPTKLRDPEWLNPTRKLQPVDTVQDQITGLSKTVSQVSDAVAEVSDAVPVAPLQIVSVSATESPVKVQGRTMSQVAVSFVRDTTDTNFAGVRVWLKNYQGDANPRLVMQGAVSPIIVLCETTGETVTVIAQAVSSSGVPADFSISPTCTVLLDGVISAPPAPSISQNLIGTPTGYQFSFNQLAAQSADVIDSYRIYRNTTNNSSTATLFDTIPADRTNSGSILVADAAQYGEIYYYWVSAVSVSGLESAKTAAQSGTVLGHAATSSLLVNSTVNINVSAPFPSTGLGDWYTGNVVSTPISGLVFDVYCAGLNNTLLEILLWANNNGSGAPQGYVFRFDGRSGQPRGSIAIANNGGFSVISNYQIANNAAALPAGWYRCEIEWYPTGLMNMYVNGVWSASAQDTTYTPTGATYFNSEWGGFAPVLVAPGNGLIQSLDKGYSLRSSPLVGQGSICNIPADALSYIATTTSITWSWSAFSVFAPDGTVLNIAAGSQAAITGLLASTTYHFYAYVNLATLTVVVVKSSQSSGTVKETQQTLAQVANGDGHVCIRPDGTASTPSSGSTGGAGGGGSTSCFTGPTDVKTPDGLVALGSLPRDRSFDIINEAGVMQAELVVHENYEGWMLKLGEGKAVTLDHLMKVDEFEWVPAAEKYPNAERVWFSGTVYNLHVITNHEEDRHFVLFNGDVAHNYKMA